MNKNYTIMIVLLIIILLNGFLLYKIDKKVNDIVIIDVIRVFNEFKMKKELESKVQVKLDAYTSKMDSVKALVEYAQSHNDSLRLKIITNYSYLLQQEAQDVYATSNRNINEQVWKRLNPMIDSYGEKNKCRAIIGANGMGTVLYKDKYIDHTEDVIKYINIKYEEGN